jgi:hypothetical protein
MNKIIAIKDLLLDENNPRLENIQDQDDALNKICSASELVRQKEGKN